MKIISIYTGDMVVIEKSTNQAPSTKGATTYSADHNLINQSPYGVAGLGCWSFGSDYWADQSTHNSKRTIATALDLGITHFDTAQVYGSGTSEQIVGQALRKVRGSVTIASKSLIPDTNDMERQVEKSLRRIGTEYLDLFYIHWPRKRGYDMRPALDSLQRCLDRQLIGSIGVSNFSKEELSLAIQVAPVQVLQLCYSPLWTREGETLFTLCKEAGVTTVGYSILAQGIMCGKFTEPPKDIRGNLVYANPQVWPRVGELLNRWSAVAQELNTSLTALTIGWALHSKGVDIPLLGARTSKQLLEQWEGTTLTISPEIMDILNKEAAVIDRAIAKEYTNQFNHRVI